MGSVVGSVVAVCAIAAVTLRILDEVPVWLAHEPRGVRRDVSIAAAELAIGERLALPRDVPADLRWPPVAVRRAVIDPASVAVTVDSVDDGGPALVIAQSVGTAAGISPDLLAPGVRLEHVAIQVNDREATLSRVRLLDGIWNEIGWWSGGRRHVVRLRGPVDQLLRIVRSMGDDRR